MLRNKQIDKATVEYVAALARIVLSEKELEQYSRQLADILDYVAKLNKLDTSTTPPTSHPSEGLRNIFRKDVVKKSLSAEEALKNAPEKKDNFFSVPKIIE